jgi:DNA adenine methylase
MSFRKKEEPVDSPIKWHGGKHYLAKRIVALCPPHLHYVEPYAGSLAVLLAKNPEGVSEVANDIDGRLTNFWYCLMSPSSFEEFRRRAEATPFCEQVWSAARERISRPCDHPGAICLNCGLAFFICCRQSLAGRMDIFAPLSRTRVRRGMNEQASAWLHAVEDLSQVHERFKRVVILNRDALDVIRQQDGPDTLFYLDPPYVHQTRITTGEYGLHEMGDEDHQALLETITSSERSGKFMLSGYRNDLYDTLLQGWRRHDFELPNNAAGGASKRRMVECLWCNF